MPSDKISLPPFRALLAFQAVATHDRMADAAASIGVTESAVSHQIRQLETQLHVTLFDRTTGRLVLTETGRRYLRRIEPALREIAAATDAVQPSGGRASVRVTLPPSLAATWLIPRLGGFESAQPGVDVQLVPTTRVMDLVRNQIDLALRYGKGAWDDAEANFLFDDLATPVAAPGYLADGADPVTALGAAKLILNRAVPHEWEEWSRARGLSPPALEDALELDTIEQVLNVAGAGHGIGMGRSPYVEDHLARGTLTAPFGQAGPTGASYYLCQPAGVTPRAPVRRFARWLQDEAAAFRAAQSQATG